MAERCGRRAYLRGLAATAVGVGLAGCGGGGDAGTDFDVSMTESLRFEPETLAVDAGTTVTWGTVGSISHSVTAYEDGIPDAADYFASGGFETETAARDGYPEGAIGQGETYAHTFEVAGTYEYFCIPHERSGMTGRVEVEER